jgi:hypothetical protein
MIQSVLCHYCRAPFAVDDTLTSCVCRHCGESLSLVVVHVYLMTEPLAVTPDKPHPEGWTGKGILQSILPAREGSRHSHGTVTSVTT